jgi:hypothetical protein
MPNQGPDTGIALLRAKVEGFRANLSKLRDVNIQELVVRQEYIDPFWQALGWDVDNTGQLAPDEKDVIIEAHVGTVEGEKKRNRRPDYLFKLGGFPRFVVEAKKPTVDLARAHDAIFQAKTYAWNAQIPFAILTDFEEFRLFDATIKPYFDDPSRGIVAEFDLRYDDYLAQWDVLVKTFGREAVAGGSLERLLASIKKVRSGRRIRGIDRMLVDLKGSTPVDRDFLAFLQGYRERFAREMFQENKASFPEAESRHGAARLTEAAQRLIDRLVFMRVCEDRDIAEYGVLRDIVDRAVDERAEVYALLCTQFRTLDREYNGYLFKPHFSEQLKISGQLLADFIRNLYPPDSPYRFDAIGDDLLGIIYERFLGSTITVHKNQVQAEDKPEVRHAGGVYYTPRFVVDAIIRRVVGPKIKDLPPAEVLNIKILDPACGSGSFLIRAFLFLIDHCARYVAAHPEAAVVAEKGKGRKKMRNIAFVDEEGHWQLSPDFRAALLTSCLFGVDIDAQAVEVTIMSLYLKMLEAKLPPHWQRDWLDNQLLPSLDNNIRCGNSLLSQTDFDRWWEHEHGMLFAGDEDVRFRMNPFDWNSQTRGFGRILDARKGFDCIIGNPPYIRVQELNKWAPDECEFYKWRYKSAAKGNYDIYVVFIERGLELLAPEGLLGFICPHKFWQATYGEGIREQLTADKNLSSVVDFGDQQVFKGATTYTAIQIFSKTPVERGVDFSIVTSLSDGEAQIHALDEHGAAEGVEKFAAARPAAENWVFRPAVATEWCEALSKGNPRLADIASIFVGLQTSADTVFLFEEWDSSEKLFYSKELARRVSVERELLRSVVRSGSIGKYWAHPTAYILFPYTVQSEVASIIPANVMKKRYPNAWKYLEENEKLLRGRENGKFDHDEWYGLMRKNLDKWETSKVMVPYMVTELSAFYDDSNLLFVNVTTGGFGVRSGKIDARLLCGYLSSDIIDRWFKAQAGKFHGGYFGANKQFIENIPIKLPETAGEKKQAEQIIERVKQIIELKKRLQATSLSEGERARLGSQSEVTEQQIDELVCGLYGVAAVPA